MKKIVIFISLTVIAAIAFAQTPNGWVNTNPSNIQISQNNTNVNEGIYSVNVTCITQDQASTEFMSVAFDVTPGTEYTATADVFENDEAGKARIAVNFDGSNSWGGFSSDEEEWETIEQTGIVPDGVTTAYVFFRFYDISDTWDGDFSCILDNVTFTHGGVAIDITNAGFENWETLEPTEYTIEQIQDTLGSGSDASNVEGELVLTSGIVTGIYDTYFTIENVESVTGEWSAIWVQNNGTSISLVDEVDVTGVVSEAYGKTTINATEIVVTGQPDIALVPYEISTNLASTEAYEAVLIQCTATCTNVNPDEAKSDFGEWLINDGSGDVRINDLGLSESFVPTLNFEYQVVGVLNYDFSNFKIEPRSLSDITLIGAGTDPIVTISSPANNSTINNVDVNIEFTVVNFDVADGTGDGHIVYTVDAGTANSQYTTDAIALSGLSEEEHTVNIELVDNTGTSLDPAVSASVTFTVELGTASDYTTIYEIQFTEEASGDSPLTGTTVTTRGVVSATNGDKFWLQDGAGGWNSLYVYYTTTPGPAIGDSVIVIGELSEYYNLTELTPTEITIVSSGNVVAGASAISTGEVSSEMYESVLVKVVGVNNTEVDSYGQWPVNDGSGLIIIDDILFPYTPTVGNSYRVTGIVEYAFDEWKMYPRDANDIEDLGVNTDPTISITSPANNANVYTTSVDVNFTTNNFTLGTDGKVAWDLDDGDATIITSSPVNVGGLTEGAHTINLELVDMSNNSLSPAVTASVTINVSLSGPVITPIYDIQYTADVSGDSPYADQVVSIEGVVTANFNGSEYGEGYYVQDAEGAWNGLYIFDIINSPNIGDSVMITGEVVEFFGMTEMKNVESFAVTYIGGTIPNPTEISTANAASEEQYESVLIKVINAECTVEQNQYGEWEVNDGSGALACKDDGAFDFTEEEGTFYDIIGVINYSYSVFSLHSRIESDIQEHTGIGMIAGIQIKAYPIPASEVLNLEIPETVNYVSIIDITGKIIEEYKANEELMSIDVSSLQSGVYFIRIATENEYTHIQITVE